MFSSDTVFFSIYNSAYAQNLENAHDQALTQLHYCYIVNILKPLEQGKSADHT